MIPVDVLKTERETLRKLLAEVDAEQKVLEAKVKEVRQREIQTKREIEALSVLIDLHEPPPVVPLPPPAPPKST